LEQFLARNIILEFNIVGSLSKIEIANIILWFY